MWHTELTIETQNLTNHCVYIIDDDAAVRDSVRMLIESDGLQAYAYDSAEAFLNRYLPGQSGCLVLDVHMPGMNGVELLEHLRARGIPIPVIIVTAYKDEQLTKRARQAGAYAVVMKPFKEGELLYLIEQALGKPL